MPQLPTVPQSITVHLGAPDSNAENVTVPFLDYVANVASSEIYPTWPENAIRANIYAQISFALNRVYTEYYRSRGYRFDITSSTAYDQYFVNGRDIFENVRQIAAELFNDYLRRSGSVEPLFAQYCNGTTVLCKGLSQWGSVELANQGYTPYEILTHYYGDNIELVKNAPVGTPSASLPAVPLALGSANDDVRTVQIRLNRISANYPSLPKILRTDGIFGTDTEKAVKRFQEIFKLTPDGRIGKSTWYTIQNIYIGVKRLNSLEAEGIGREEVTAQYPGTLREGSRGGGTRNLQFFLNYLSGFYDTIPPVTVDGVFGPETTAAVKAAQRTFGLPEDGIVGATTWESVYRAYRGIVTTVPLEYFEGNTVPYQGNPLRIGSEGAEVRLLQEYLNYVARSFSSVPTVPVTGYFGPLTEESVIAFQALEGMETTGLVQSSTWTALTDLYDTLYTGTQLKDGQFPGYTVGAE